MAPTFFDDDATNGDGNEKDADALDRALDAIARGDRRKAKRLDRDMREVVDRIYALAEISGMTPAGAALAPPTNVTPLRTRLHVKQVMSAVSTIAAIVILAIGVNATVPGLPLGSGSIPTAVPTSDASDRDDPRQFAPFSPDECNVAPRSREQVLAILGVPPDNGTQDHPPVALIDPADVPLDDIMADYRVWQACMRYGITYQAMALETIQYIREDIYGTGYPLDAAFKAYVDTPFSDSTLNELLDAKEARDNAWNQNGGIYATSQMILWAVPERGINASEDGTFIAVPVAFFNLETGTQESDIGHAFFQLVNGRWLIASHDLPELGTP